MPHFSSSFFVYCIILQRVTTGKVSILYIRMIMKRTFYYYKWLIFNDLRGFIGGGGGKNGQSIVWCKPFISEKEKISSGLKNFQKKEKLYIRVYMVNFIYIVYFIILVTYIYNIVIFIYSIYYF